MDKPQTQHSAPWVAVTVPRRKPEGEAYKHTTMLKAAPSITSAPKTGRHWAAYN